ncbi:DNA methyltransferase [Photobacterium iliopiscarium]|uniref:DNA methyltransferase n=1 Tax=Photobacterium iliopiscarium TaxID=56192 RepID=UPI002430BD13|nr:DNA methyltransferase [Photobacterium iliopiscarium]
MAVNQTAIFDALESQVTSSDQTDFIYSFLKAYDTPKSTITLLKKGDSTRNVAQTVGHIALKNELYFCPVSKGDDLAAALSDCLQQPLIAKNKIRFILVTDYSEFLAFDLKAGENLHIDFAELHQHYTFFLPLVGIEKAVVYSENPADVRAAEKMGKLFDALRIDNPLVHDVGTPEYSIELHHLNVFLTRLLFCFFAEDTAIFGERQFTNTVDTVTNKDGSDVQTVLSKIFSVMNVRDNDAARQNQPTWLTAFPYVNGGLFRDETTIPNFSVKSRRLLLECGQLDWSSIHPDIFGSMFQSVIDEAQRSNLGQHYTSVTNIMKVIKPLFLDKLEADFEKAQHNEVRLNALLMRLEQIKCFDPACGSGNFLIIAYKELRLFEMRVIKRLKDVMFSHAYKKQLKTRNDHLKKERTRVTQLNQPEMLAQMDAEMEKPLPESEVVVQYPLFSTGIRLEQFYGIEIDDFAHEVAKLALWLTEHQLNQHWEQEIGTPSQTLPLRSAGSITCGNSLRLDWHQVCPKTPEDEVYVIGNPPFLGTTGRSTEQKADMAYVFKGFKAIGYLDFVACWFWKGSQYIQQSKAELALVSTNSICQGEQVATLWPAVFSLGLNIHFAYQSFNWANNARDKAAVHVVVIGLTGQKQQKKIFSPIQGTWHEQDVRNVSPYLVEGTSLVVLKRAKPLIKSNLMIFGNKPTDGGNFFFNESEKNEFLNREPKAEKWVRKVVGSEEFLNSKARYCLWLKDITESELSELPLVSERVENIRKLRLKAGHAAALKMAKTPHLFMQISQPDSGNYLLIPRVSSEHRIYIPIGFLDSDTISTDRNFMIPNGTLYDFGILMSMMHNDWMRIVAGRLESRYSYSNTIVYNTFPWPEVSESQKQEIELLAEEILLTREDYPHMTLAQLYDPNKMPADLLAAHQALDQAVERAYRAKPFENQEERVAFLLQRYAQLVLEEEGDNIKPTILKRKTKTTTAI